MSSTLSIVIVSYNCREALRTCLRSLSAAESPHATRPVSLPAVIVIDNTSRDDSAGMVRSEFPWVTLIANTDNRGFAAACNQGITATGSDYVLLLNPDTQITGETLRMLLSVMQQDPTIGACGPRILNDDGTLQRSCRAFPTLGGLICDELGLSTLFGSEDHPVGYKMSAGPLSSTREVDQLGGSCLLLRRAALEQVGLLDERFFVYFEEVDLCLRLNRAGWKIWYVYDAVITHSGGQSSKSDVSASLMYRYRSLFAFFRKHHSAWQVGALKLAVQAGTAMRAFTGHPGYGTVARTVWRL